MCQMYIDFSVLNHSMRLTIWILKETFFCMNFNCEKMLRKFLTPLSLRHLKSLRWPGIYVKRLYYTVEWVEFFNFAETFFMESPLPPESKMVHIIEIGCVQNCHKAWENWAKICLFAALSGGILKKLKRSNSRPKIISVEPNEYLLSLLRSWEMSKNSFFRQKINCFVAVLYATDFNNMHHSELRK